MHHKALFRIAVLALATGLSLSCDKKTDKTENNKQQDSASIVQDSALQVSTAAEIITDTIHPVGHPIYNEFARYVAGYGVSKQSQYYQSTQEAYWQKFATKQDSAWKSTDRNRFSIMKNWAKTELKDANAVTTNVLYPLSGPDFLNANIFFPNAQQYVLFALEPVGNFPDFKNQKEDQKAQYLNSVEKSISDIFEKSYFITRKMLTDLQQNNVNGTLPIICLFLARTDNTITNVERAWIDSTGTLNTAPFNDPKYKKRPYAVKVSFFPNGHPEQKKSVVYIKADLENRAFNKNIGLQKFLNSNFTDAITYLKSASYVLHYKDFSGFRNILLDRTKFLLQDDTGVAYRFFKPSEWDITLYGRYAKPVEDFNTAGVDQPDLQKAYKDSTKVQKLPFSLGYHWGTKDQNMMKATKK
jgi:hypothetical protein